MPPFVARKRERSASPLSDVKRPAAPRAARTPRSNKKKPTLFDDLEAKPNPPRSVEENQEFLAQLDIDQDDEDELSEISSNEFEDIMPESASKRRKLNDTDEVGDEDEEMAWEDAIPDGNEQSIEEPSISGNLELTLDSVPTHTMASVTNKDGKKGPSKIERGIRINTHCMHVQYLLFHNFLRNSWTCDKDVQKALLRTLTPGMNKEVDRWKSACGDLGPKETKDEDTGAPPKVKGKAKEKASKPGKKYHNQRDWGNGADRAEPGAPNLSHGDPTLRLLKFLSAFWRKRFTVTAPGLRKQGYKELARLEEEVKLHRNDKHNPELHGERIRDRTAFRKVAERCEGSRDAGAQLFTSLLRGIGLEARLVANLQPVGFGWSKSEEAHPSKKLVKGAAPAEDIAHDTSESEAEVEEATPSKKPPAKKNGKPVKGSTKARSKRPINSGGHKDAPIDLSDSEDELHSNGEPSEDDSVIDITPSAPPKSSKRFDRDLSFPVYWTEVLSPISKTWIPIDPTVLSIVANNPEKLALFEPRGAKADRAKQVFAYVIAFSADGSAKDVTVRYLKRHMWPGKTKGLRIPAEKMPIYNRRGKVLRYEEVDWFADVMRLYVRPSLKRTEADRLEDANELRPVRVVREPKVGGEETLQGYKSSAEFVLERHLRREEALLPHAKQVKTFTTGKGDKAQEEPVYLRKDVVPCRTIESWHKEGRAVKEGERPLKHVPIRAVTLIRKREIEEAERESGEKMKQALYSRAQTDWIIPPPISNGVIPKNAFGNMDVYVPTMVPKGAVHIRLKGTARICKKLGIDFAEACTGFEFGNKRAVPVLTGVVVAKENEGTVRDAWRADDAEKKRKEREKREKLALGMWKKMLAGLRIVERVRREYGDDAESRIKDAVHPMAAKKKGKAVAEPKGKASTGRARRATNAASKNNNAGNTHHIDIDSDIESHPDHGGGGFLPNDDDDDDAEASHQQPASPEAGGFILEDDSFSTSIAKPKATQRPTRTPKSLQSLHQQESIAPTPSPPDIYGSSGDHEVDMPDASTDGSDDENDDDDDNDENQEQEQNDTDPSTPSTPPLPKRTKTSTTRKPKSPQKPTTTDPRSNTLPKPKRVTAAAKPRSKSTITPTTTSSHISPISSPSPSSSSSSSSSPPPSEADEPTPPSRKRGSSTRAGRGTRGTPGTRGARGGRVAKPAAVGTTGVVRRNAGRKSKEGVRSRYFEGGEGGGVGDVDGAVAGGGSGEGDGEDVEDVDMEA